MELKHKIAQMLVIGFKGKDLKDEDKIVEDLTKRKIGGVILFDRNIETWALGEGNIESPDQLQKLTTQLQKYAKNSLLISVDYEGGDQQLAIPGKSFKENRGLGVSRLNEAYGFPYTYSAQEFSSLPNAVKESTTEAMAATAKAMGINLVLAPVLDLKTKNSTIAARGRAFAPDAKTVIENASLFIHAYKSYGIASCLKHYPGNGSVDITQDTHDSSADVTDSWNPEELEPFKALGPEVGIVMTGHMSNNKLDPSGMPATFSKIILDGLRNIIGSQGIIIADDLQMKAATMDLTLKETLTRAIHAGCDILPFGNMLVNEPDIAEKAIDTVLSQIKEGKITEARIDESYQRIIALKKHLRLIDQATINKT